MYKRRILAITLVSLTPVLATAEPSCKVDPAKKKLYRLELTVPAAFLSVGRSRGSQLQAASKGITGTTPRTLA